MIVIQRITTLPFSVSQSQPGNAFIRMCGLYDDDVVTYSLTPFSDK